MTKPIGYVAEYGSLQSTPSLMVSLSNHALKGMPVVRDQPGQQRMAISISL